MELDGLRRWLSHAAKPGLEVAGLPGIDVRSRASSALDQRRVGKSVAL
jgi:hypothetical protein